MEVAADLRHRVDLLGAELDPLVLEQPARQFRPRILHFLSGVRLAHRQQHPGLDVDQQRRHQQVFRGQFEVVVADLVDVGQVLARDVGHRDVEDVEVLLADQVQQKVQRTFERLQEDLERVGRNVEIARKLKHRLAVEAGHDLQFELLGLAFEGFDRCIGARLERCFRERG